MGGCPHMLSVEAGGDGLEVRLGAAHHLKLSVRLISARRRVR
jgi:hypothetical protein